MVRVPRAPVFGWAALSCLPLSACTGTAPAPAVCGAQQGSSQAAQSLVSGDTSFALAFYGPAVTATGGGQNMIVSPYSISAALTMVDVGAAGETATQMQTVLHLPGAGADVAPAYAALACEDETDGTSDGNELSIANSLWAQQGKAFEPSFLSVLSSGYAAPLHQVDFRGDANRAEDTINQWVSNATQAQIPALLLPGDVTAATQLVLVDAVYFNGVWDEGFDPAKTSPQPFTLSDGTTASVPMMSGDVSLGIGGGSAPAFSVYELPYKGRALVMDFLLPSGSLSSFEAGLTPDVLNGALTSVGSHTAQVILRLPRFSITTRLGPLVPFLAGMGMPDVFDPRLADLSGMDGARDLYVSTVVHEAQVQVDEQGTIATAATAAGVSGATCTCPAGPEIVSIDQPFLFLIRDTKNGSILFMGRVEDPRQGS
jgi:serpin B